MQTVIVPAGRGWRWFGEGFALFRRNPPGLALIVIMYWLLIAMINVLPLLGPVLASVAMPAFSVGIMTACRDLERTPPQPGAPFIGIGVLFSAFRRGPAPLFVLGGLYLALTLLILALASLVDDGTLMQFMQGEIELQQATAEPRFVLAMQFAMLLLMPVVMAFWYAPLLVAWHGFRPAKALFFSFFACLRNWRAFLAYGISLAVWCVIMPGLLMGVLAGLLADAKLVFALISAPVLLLLAPTVFATFYITYREVFVAAEHIDVSA